MSPKQQRRLTYNFARLQSLGCLTASSSFLRQSLRATTVLLLVVASVVLRSSLLGLTNLHRLYEHHIGSTIYRSSNALDGPLSNSSFRPLHINALAPLTVQQRGQDFPPLEKIPTLVHAPKPFFLCSVAKTGSTTWVGFVMFVNHGVLINPNMYKNNPGAVHRAKEKLKQNATADTAKIDPTSSRYYRNLDRIVMARNPYIRFLSSYLDWMSRHTARKTVTLDEFADMYVQRNFSNYPGNTQLDHIDPVSSLCGMDRLAYSQVYRLEEIPLWYHDFLRRYGLQSHMDQYTANGNLVYEPALDASALLSEYTAQVVGRQPWPGKKLQLRHHHDEFAVLVNQYYTPRIAAIVTQAFLNDFVKFQYPLWDGNPATFRYT